MDNRKRQSRPRVRQQGEPAASRTFSTSSNEIDCNTSATGDPTPTPVRRADGKKVGELVDDVLTKTARASRHMLRKPRRAWAWDIHILRQAEQKGVRWTEIHELDSGRIYRAAIADFWAHGFTLDRGYGKQRALPIGCWKVRHPSESPSDELVQLSLPFGTGQ